MPHAVPGVPHSVTDPGAIAWWRPMLLGALAGGMGWGIRGQYGHETGAMIAGVLLGFTLCLQLARHLPLDQAARAIAWGTAAIGIGGSMTYGQTIGLTQNAPMVGNSAAYGWGMLGLAIKGALWIGFAGAFFGMGFGGRRYRPVELAAMLGVLYLLFVGGTHLLNAPFDPSQRLLPRIYFSADWRWEPGAELKPRREVWGGYLFALAGLLAYLAWVRRDPLAWRLGLWGTLGGALGFPLGQSIQAYHAWHPDRFTTGLWRDLAPVVNWWNMMETTFGLILGASLGLGLWLHRRRILPAADAPATMDVVLPRPWMAWAVAATVLGHVIALLAGEFSTWPVLGSYTECGLIMVMVPVVGCAWNRGWSFLLALPVTLLPIAAKSMREFSSESGGSSPVLPALLLLGILPVGVLTWLAVRFARERPSHGTEETTAYARAGLLATAWTYYLLNYAFFRFPWPWMPWTTRTPSALLFTACLAGLTWSALAARPRRS